MTTHRPARGQHRGDPALAVAYLRVSTEDQHLGPEAQRASIQGWAVRAGVEVISWAVDHGVSGAAPIEQRPGLLQALGDLRSRNAGILVVARRDRLAREVTIAALVERLVGQTAARVVSAAGEGTDTSADDPTGMLLRGMIDLMAQYERALIALRTRAALRAKRARGERAGTVPWGFYADAEGRLYSHATELGITTRISALRQDGLSQRAIVAQMAREGFCSRSGRPLRLSQVQRRLRDLASQAVTTAGDGA